MITSTGYTALGAGVVAAGRRTSEFRPPANWALAAILRAAAAAAGFLLLRPTGPQPTGAPPLEPAPVREGT